MPNNYDAAAWFYDRLAQLVFGKTVINAQQFLIKDISENTKVLIVGGGTGWILEEIAAINAATLEITYVEISKKMISLSKNRNYRQNKIYFIHAAIEDFELNEHYDVILTPFLFDNFSDKRIKKVFDKLHKSLKKNGLWLLCDFQLQENYSGIWQKILLKLMYLFFCWLCDVETKTLVPMHDYFAAKNYLLLKEKTFYHGFIISRVYLKP